MAKVSCPSTTVTELERNLRMRSSLPYASKLVSRRQFSEVQAIFEEYPLSQLNQRSCCEPVRCRTAGTDRISDESLKPTYSHSSARRIVFQHHQRCIESRRFGRL